MWSCSSRNTDAIYLIDKISGKIIYLEDGRTLQSIGTTLKSSLSLVIRKAYSTPSMMSASVPEAMSPSTMIELGPHLSGPRCGVSRRHRSWNGNVSLVLISRRAR